MAGRGAKTPGSRSWRRRLIAKESHYTNPTEPPREYNGASGVGIIFYSVRGRPRRPAGRPAAVRKGACEDVDLLLQGPEPRPRAAAVEGLPQERQRRAPLVVREGPCRH